MLRTYLEPTPPKYDQVGDHTQLLCITRGSILLTHLPLHFKAIRDHPPSRIGVRVSRSAISRQSRTPAGMDTYMYKRSLKGRGVSYARQCHLPIMPSFGPYRWYYLVREAKDCHCRVVSPVDDPRCAVFGESETVVLERDLVRWWDRQLQMGVCNECRTAYFVTVIYGSLTIATFGSQDWVGRDCGSDASCK